MAIRKKAKSRSKGTVKRRKAPARRPAPRKSTARPAKKPARRATFSRAAPKRKAIAPPAPPAAEPPPPGERIGVVTHYYGQPSVAIVKLESATLRLGDTVHFRGHTSDFSQRVESLQVEHAAVDAVGPNDDFGIKVAQPVREHDVVYKVAS